MNTGDTRKNLIELIAKHQINHPGKKLKLSELSSQAGISRQSFHRFYNDLKQYLSGKSIQGIREKLDSSTVSDLLSQSQKRIAELEFTIANLELKHLEQLKDLDDTYITALMNDDISLFDASEVRQNMVKHSLHIHELLKKIAALEADLTKEKLKQITGILDGGTHALAGKTVIIEPNLHQLFDRFHQHKDQNRFENEKDEEVFKLAIRINKLLSATESKIIIFIDRYFSSFEKFTRDYVCDRATTHIFIRLPLFSQLERKHFLNSLEKKGSVSVHFPFCESDSILRAQRTFLFRNIPASEANAADKAQPPTIKDGYSNVCMSVVRQGD